MLDNNQILIDFQELYPKTFLRLGLDKATYLGSGEQGVVVTISNKIVKISTSKAEAKASSKFVGKNFRNIVNVYSVKQVGTLKPLFVIEQELLFPISNKQIKDCVSYVTYEAEFNKKFKKMSSVEVAQDIKKEFSIKSSNKLLKVIDDIKNGIKELAAVGVTYSDFHHDNVMQDKAGNLKLVDFGYAKTKGSSKIDSLKECIRLIVKEGTMLPKQGTLTKKGWYHLSKKDLGDEFEFTPRIPREPFRDLDGNVIEDDFTKRTSWAPSIKSAIKALEVDINRYIFSVYFTENLPGFVDPSEKFDDLPTSDDNVYGIDFNLEPWEKWWEEKNLPKKALEKPNGSSVPAALEDLVPDAEFTGECWATKFVLAKKVARILVNHGNYSIL